MAITYSRLTAPLDRRRGLPPHVPSWCAVDCPECAHETFTGCGPHRDVLTCAECDEDWPCPPVQLVVEELFDRARQLNELAAETAPSDLQAGLMYAVDHLRDRARYLEGTT